ncbi:MAG TPA: alpha-E domain-containing protein [Polyangia bacterium]|nr:alpha-E domain-containing protein [Polyangia bacterium]
MISRVADHCFWVGRYLDRAESTARLLQVTRALAFDGDLSALQCWRPLVTVSGQYEDFTERFGVDAAGHGEVVQQYMTWALENPVSVRNSVRAAREGARSIREVLSSDIWQATNELFLWFVGEEASTQFKQDRDGLYRNVRKATQLCLGLVRSTMLHDTPMDFLWLGVLLERLGQTARILDMHHHMMGGSPAGGQHQDEHQIVQTALWLSLLRACSGFDAFMRQHQGRVSRAAVVSFLIFENRFPRSLRYCLRSALAMAQRIWPASDARADGGAVERLQALDHWLDAQQKQSPPTSIHELLTHIVDQTSLTCQAVQRGMSGQPTVAADATEKTQTQSQ